MNAHPLQETGLSQCEAILSELHRANGEWVAMPHLGDVSGSRNVHSRIDELRHKYRHDIESKQVRKGRQCHSFYRLKSNMEQLALDMSA